ncbi:TetR/AcrR family transcriptional regulator [Fibrella aquatilis]|uniref:TetR/AcrR family transcriptional regulator n=1 Tax=Fibrella aquatilis TaxID=2817059 RepID=A0A939G0A3_9BACT|nr:TetR/AcrR family transcriptional regulator [Fibrella aquatilis]MBO0930012.1 TetR/AcrR family transcriptional regulator [Fibrella aquatilis]
MARPKAFAEQDALQAAMETFWQKGYHQTSMQDLVDAMGINRASLYDTFADKHTLYKLALVHYADLNRAELTEAIAEAESARAKIQLIFDRVVQEIVDDSEQKGCFLTNATLEMLPHYPDVATIITDDTEALTATLHDLLHEGIAAKEFRAKLPVDEVVPYLISQLSGLRVLGKTNASPTMLKAVVELAMKTL